MRTTYAYFRNTNLHFVSYILIIVFFCFINTTKAQCFISTTSVQCVGEPIVFNCNSSGSSNFQWDFNGQGSNTTTCQPAFTFNTPGSKTIQLSLKLSNGSTCKSTLVIDVKEKPSIKIKLNSPKSQCFKTNQFCFTDSSTIGSFDSICELVVVFDDGSKYTSTGKGPRSFCHSFQDPAGGTYGMTVEVYSCNGCVSKQRYNSIMHVLPSLGLSFSSAQPRRCDSVYLCITNNSLVALDSIKAFVWDWGDGQKDSGNKTSTALWRAKVSNGICHLYKIQGPNNGSFDITLSVETFGSCKETFTYKDVATNIIIKPEIVASFDSVCYSNPTITFKLKDGPVILGANPLYVFEQIPNPNNTVRNWTSSHTFTATGPSKVAFSFTHPYPGCGKTIYDTILVIGPQSMIEGRIGSTAKYMDVERSFQCIIKDTVQFTNLSQFYHNDNAFRDDDSTLLTNSGFNAPLMHVFNSSGSVKSSVQKRGNACIGRLWDFDDPYCESCTTDTKNGENIGKNCRYSKDSLPQHWYTPWDELYQRQFDRLAIKIPSYDKDSGFYTFRKLWADDSIAIIRDTILYYGDNALAIKTKDSLVYNGLKKLKVAAQITGISKTYISKSIRVYLPAGDTAYIDQNNGFPPTRYIGGRYINVQAGSNLTLLSKTDKVLYAAWVEFTQDTVLLSNLNGRIAWKKQLIPGYILGDSINPAVHRQKFYESNIVKCFAAKLKQKDICHPMACEHEVVKSLSLFPASAKNLRKTGVQCLGFASNSYGITFILDDTKPGCSFTWAELNFDTAKDINGWLPAVGKNLTEGQISMGDLPPLSPPYQVPNSGYQNNGAPGTHFSKQFNLSDIKDTLNGYIDVGLITGSGIWPGAVYPAACQDTVYYPKFARFPILNNSFRIISVAEGSEYTKVCRKQDLAFALTANNHTNVDDVSQIEWSISSDNSGKNFDQMHSVYVRETYKRFQKVHKDSNFLMNYLMVVKRQKLGLKETTIDSQYFPISRINKWHTEADISKVFDQFKQQLSSYNINVLELSPSEIAASVWNGIGSIGKAYTGSRGIVDTSGFGNFIDFTTVVDSKKILHFKDTSLGPITSVKGYNGITYQAYNLSPTYSGFYRASLNMVSSDPGQCAQMFMSSKKVIVGFYSNMGYMDTIICHGQQVVASPEFRYFDIYPEITFRILDPTDYWHDRIQEAGNPNREGYVHHDLNKKDDDINIPKTIFGGFPYSITGLSNAPNKKLILSGGVNSIYYNKDTGDMYLIRTSVSDSTDCRDTFSQKIYTTAVRAKIKLDQTVLNCSHILELTDSSYVIDPCVKTLGSSCDKIIKWTIDWGDKSLYAIETYFDVLPSKLGHLFVNNGKITIKLRVETALGCISYDSINVYFTGPQAAFEPVQNKEYCIGEKVYFKNTSKYNRSDSSVWVWDFGDGQYFDQFDTIQSDNDTAYRQYAAAGTYNVKMQLYYHKKIGNKQITCSSIYPDTSLGQQKIMMKIIKCDSTSISDYKLGEMIRLFPNPAINSITIDSDFDMYITIYDLRGVFIEKVFCESRKTVDVRHLSKGLYILRSEQQQVLGKLIVE